MGYIDMLKKGKVNDVKLASSGRKDALDNQGGKCALCKTVLNRSYCKYVDEGRGMKIFCLDCFFGKKK